MMITGDLGLKVKEKTNDELRDEDGGAGVGVPEITMNPTMAIGGICRGYTAI